MTRFLSAPAAAVLLALAALPASAQYVADALPPFEVMTIVRSMGMNPLHRPVWKNGYYVLRAIDRYGDEVRIIVNARNGRVMSVRPAGSRDDDFAARPGPPRGGYPVPDYDDDGEFYDEGGRRLVPPRLSPPVISAPRERAETRSAAIDPSTLPLPRPKPAEANIQPAEIKPAETKPAPRSASGEPPPKPEGEIRVIEIYKKPEALKPDGEAEKNNDNPPVSPLEDTSRKPNL